MIKKIFLILVTMTLSSCATIKDKIPNVGECPSMSERTISDAFCKEKK